MFIRNKNYDNCIQKVRVDVGTYVGLDKDDEAFITLRELPTFEMLGLKDAYDKGEEEIIRYIKEILPALIVDHNFYEDEKTKMTNEALSNLIFEKVDLANKVIREYTSAAFFTPQRVKDSK